LALKKTNTLFARSTPPKSPFGGFRGRKKSKTITELNVPK
jgi:hypothetical protein